MYVNFFFLDRTIRLLTQRVEQLLDAAARLLARGFLDIPYDGADPDSGQVERESPLHEVEAESHRVTKFDAAFVPLGRELLSTAPELYRTSEIADPTPTAAAVDLPRDALYPFLPGGVLQPRCGRIESLLRLFLAERMHWADTLDLAVEAWDQGDEWVAALDYAAMAEEGSEVAGANVGFLARRVWNHRRAGMDGDTGRGRPGWSHPLQQSLQRWLAELRGASAPPPPQQALYVPLLGVGSVAFVEEDGAPPVAALQTADQEAWVQRRLQGAATALRFLTRSARMMAPDSVHDAAQIITALRDELLKGVDAAEGAERRAAILTMIAEVDGLEDILHRAGGDLDRLVYLLLVEAAIWGDYGALYDAGWALLRGAGTAADPALARGIFRYLVGADFSFATTLCGAAGLAASYLGPGLLGTRADAAEGAARYPAAVRAPPSPGVTSGPRAEVRGVWALEDVLLSMLLVAFTSVVLLRGRRVRWGARAPQEGDRGTAAAGGAGGVETARDQVVAPGGPAADEYVGGTANGAPDRSEGRDGTAVPVGTDLRERGAAGRDRDQRRSSELEAQAQDPGSERQDPGPGPRPATEATCI